MPKNYVTLKKSCKILSHFFVLRFPAIFWRVIVLKSYNSVTCVIEFNLFCANCSYTCWILQRMWWLRLYESILHVWPKFAGFSQAGCSIVMEIRKLVLGPVHVYLWFSACVPTESWKPLIEDAVIENYGYWQPSGLFWYQNILSILQSWPGNPKYVSWIEIFELWFVFHWNLFWRVQLTISHYWFR